MKSHNGGRVGVRLRISSRLILGVALMCAPALVGAQSSEPAASEPPPQVVLDLKSLVEQSRFAEAFDLGLKNEAMVGDPLFDYYFGIAAIDSGRASLGVLALERVLLSNPGNDLARLELARGYFVLQDFERAREEFTIMAAKNLPTPVRASIDKYLASIRAQDPQFRRVFKAFADYGVGRNSNVTAIADGAVPFPLFGKANPPIFVSAGDTESSPLGQLAVGGQVTGPVIPGLKYLLAVDASHRQYSGIDNFDQGSGTLTGALETAGDGDRYRAFGFLSEAQLDGEKLRTTAGAAVDFLRPINKALAVRAAVSYAQLRYGTSALDRDSDLFSFGSGFNYFLGGPFKAAVDVELTLAREDNQRNNDFFSRDIWGVRFAVGGQPAPRLQSSLTISYSNSAYDEADPIGIRITDKVDDLFGVEFALQYQLTRGWSVRGEFLYNRNQSNEPLFEYEQRIALLKMRYEWK